jgi:PAS domain S-box-containing protein
MALVAFWTQPIGTAIDLTRAAFRTAIETGDLTFACYAMYQTVTDLLLRNDPLDEVWRESEMALEFTREAKYGDAAQVVVSQQRFIATMQGRTPTFSTFSDSQFDEATFEARLTGVRMPLMICLYWILKLQARFLAGDYVAALAASQQAKPRLVALIGEFKTIDYFYYTALTVAALYENGSADEQAGWRELLTSHQEQLREWVENYPPTFADKHALVSAEIARLEGRDADAMRLYEEAIRSAHDHGFVQNEALAYEVAARFYAARGVERIAHVYLRDARYCYLQWGAHGKVKQLDERYPGLSEERALTSGAAATIGAPVAQLDVETVVKASQAVSGEIVLENLIKTLMVIAVEHAGAERGLLILPRGDQLWVQATGRKAVEVNLRQTLVASTELPLSILQYVIRTQQPVISNDASREKLFSADEYVASVHVRSVLCLPLIRQVKLVGVLYLENKVAASVFTPARIAILEVLAAQAAISLENTRLYSDLQEREAKVRRLVESNIIGIFIWNFEGHIIEANEAFLQMVGYSRDDVVSDRVRWTALTPSEWRDADEQAVAELRRTGTCKAFEKQYFRNDGSLPVLLGGATFGGGRDQGVAFVLDLTERKEAEENLRESERRYRDVQAELAHVTRVTTLGELSASIAHEVNQPLAAVLANAEACLLWLGRETPNLDKARRSVEWIINDCSRAGAVIQRIRALAKRTNIQREPLQVNDVIGEVVSLLQREMFSHRVSLRKEIASALPMVFVDRIQLQQVIVNLMINSMEAMQSVTDRPRELTIRSRRDGAHQVLLTVEDRGVGISAENAERLFSPFFTTKPTGMGMGLSICRSIIEAHGGRLWAESNLLDGAAFHFTLPLRQEETS